MPEEIIQVAISCLAGYEEPREKGAIAFHRGELLIYL
jgi:hypothetical protein